MSKKIEGKETSKEVKEFAEKLARGEIEPLHPDAEPPVFITEEMEAEALARGDTSFTEPPIFITRVKKE